MTDFNVRELTDGVWQLADGSASYLVCGNKSALVIDTSFGDTDIKKLAESITDKPLTLVNTHCHRDHTGNNYRFDMAYMHRLDIANAGDTGCRIEEIGEGFIFDLGGRHIEVLHTPGHTAGGICLADAENKVIFTGDMVADKPIYMGSADADTEAYLKSLKRILEYGDRGFTMLPSHGSIPVGFDVCRELTVCAEGVLSGELKGKKAKIFLGGQGIRVMFYQYERGGLFLQGA